MFVYFGVFFDLLDALFVIKYCDTGADLLAKFTDSHLYNGQLKGYFCALGGQFSLLGHGGSAL